MTDPIVITPRQAPLSGASKPETADTTAPEAAEHKRQTTKLWLYVGGVALLGALYWVFLVLPARVTSTATESNPATAGAAPSTQAEQTAATPTTPTAGTSAESAPQVVSPFRDAQLARAKEQAEKELATFVELQIELEEQLHIADWGQSRYDAVKDLATQGDSQFQSREFESALDTYRRATQALDELRAAGEADFAASIDAGNAALDDFNQLLAQREFGNALKIKVDNTVALEGMKRAEQLPQIQALLRKARQLARRGDTQAATSTYNEILAIDPDTATVPEALAELKTAATLADYQDHLSRGFAALERGQHSAAKKSFNAALGIRPNDAVAKGGLQQIAQETEVLGLQQLQRTARAAVSEERWDDAVTAFDKALKADPNLAFAQQGRRDAAERQRLDRGMGIIVAQAEKLSDNVRMQQAIELLAQASGLPSAGPKWDNRLSKAQATVASYQRPVAVRLTSDNATQVTVYKVGRIGAFATHDLELRPGAYTIVGSADGCQDVRKEIIVKPQMGPVEIRCENRL